MAIVCVYAKIQRWILEDQIDDDELGPERPEIPAGGARISEHRQGPVPHAANEPTIVERYKGWDRPPEPLVPNDLTLAGEEAAARDVDDGFERGREEATDKHEERCWISIFQKPSESEDKIRNGREVGEEGEDDLRLIRHHHVRRRTACCTGDEHVGFLLVNGVKLMKAN